MLEYVLVGIPPLFIIVLVDAIGCVSVDGRSGTVGKLVVAAGAFSTAVGVDDAIDAGAGGIGANEDVVVLETTPARSHGFGGEGILVVVGSGMWRAG